jgi:hypothetical protein
MLSTRARILAVSWGKQDDYAIEKRAVDGGLLNAAEIWSARRGSGSKDQDRQPLRSAFGSWATRTLFRSVQLPSDVGPEFLDQII